MMWCFLQILQMIPTSLVDIENFCMHKSVNISKTKVMLTKTKNELNCALCTIGRHLKPKYLRLKVLSNHRSNECATIA